MTVTREEVDGLLLLLDLGVHKIVHDLSENEKICPTCKGVGLIKAASAYGLTAEHTKYDDPFPYRHEWLAMCHHCYMGKIRVCPLCDGYLDRTRTRCECKAAEAIRSAEAAAKEHERRKTLPRIEYKDYELEMVYCDGCTRYIMTDSIEDHLEDCDGEVFACFKAKASIEPSAATVIDEIERLAAEEVEDGEDRIVFKPNAESVLDATLGVWFEKYVECMDVYWQDNKLIVEVPRGQVPEVPDGE